MNLKILQSDQSTLIPSTFLWLSASKLEPGKSSAGYHLSQSLFVPSASRCWLSVAGPHNAKQEILSDIAWNCNVPPCQWKSIPSIDAVPGPRFLRLTEEAINRSLHLVETLTWMLENLHWYHQVRNTPSCPAPSGLKKKLNKLKSSLNGVPGDPVAELQRGASLSSLLFPLPLGSLDCNPTSNRQGPRNESGKLCSKMMFPALLLLHRYSVYTSWELWH